MTLSKTFVWRGMEFTWNGRRYRWEHCSDGNSTWWVSRTDWWAARIMDKKDLDEPPAEQDARFASCGYLAHCGAGGDAAERDTREEALEGSLQYAIRFHHTGLARLRKILFSGQAE